ncbi:hypothetical protein BvCmsHHP011_01755 [Escherichia coli]|nr:hypothetical protein BvCmsHHP011_01755 [Escherichia coli]GDV46968.1 hypothetical protein BvCmsSIP078_02152 [Escherichia coli]
MKVTLNISCCQGHTLFSQRLMRIKYLNKPFLLLIQLVLMLTFLFALMMKVQPFCLVLILALTN